MKRIGLAVTFIIIALLLSRTDARAVETIESQIAQQTGITRTVDTSLRALAAKRAVEIISNFSHSGSWDGSTYEVIGWNSGYSDPIATVVAAWLASPDHATILNDSTLHYIGCGSAYVSSTNRWYFACELTKSQPASAPTPSPSATSTPSPSPASVPTPTPSPQASSSAPVASFQLPNTAFRR